MKLDAILCNHAESANNLLYVSGGGINLANVPADAPGPYAVNIAFGLIVTVPWEEIGKPHAVRIELVDEDGRPVIIPGSPSTERFWVDLSFSVRETKTQTTGDDQTVALAANLISLPLPGLGKYEFIMSIAGHELRRLPFRVQALDPADSGKSG